MDCPDQVNSKTNKTQLKKDDIGTSKPKPGDGAEVPRSHPKGEADGMADTVTYQMTSSSGATGLFGFRQLALASPKNQ